MNNPESNNPGNPPTVYTVYQGGGQVNYGFHPQAPPPKYEDVMSGRPGNQQFYPPYPPPQPPPPTEVYRQEVIPVTLEYKSKINRAVGLLFTLVFLIATISILVKIM